VAQISMIAVDLAKNVFQLHGVGSGGELVVQKQLRRSDMLPFFRKLEPTIVGLEACAGSHYWGRELTALGHEVRLVPPRYVKPFVQRQKNDTADAAAICAAMQRPGTAFVPPKSPERQATQVALRARELLVRQKFAALNALRAHMLEFGVVAPKGTGTLMQVVARLNASTEVPEYARAALQVLIDQIYDCDDRIAELGRRIVRRCREDELAQRLMTVPGIGPLGASAISAAAPDAGRFTSARHFSAWLGLVPRQHSSGGKAKLGGITKMGDRTIRKLLVSGAMAVIIAERRKPGFEETWIGRLVARKAPMVAATALANKIARIAWAVMSKNTIYAAKAA